MLLELANTRLASGLELLAEALGVFAKWATGAPERRYFCNASTHVTRRFGDPMLTKTNVKPSVATLATRKTGAASKSVITKGAFADSLSAASFQPSMKLTSVDPKGPRALFERVLSSAFTTYREANDSDLQAARATSTLPSSAVAPFPKVIASDRKVAEVSRRLASLPINEDVHRLLVGGTTFTFGPAADSTDSSSALG